MVAENCKIKLPRTSYHLADFCPKGNREGLPGVTMHLKSGDDNGGVALVCKGHQEGSNPLGGGASNVARRELSEGDDDNETEQDGSNITPGESFRTLPGMVTKRVQRHLQGWAKGLLCRLIF